MEDHSRFCFFKTKFMKRLSFIIQFKIEFFLPFTSRRKVLGKMPGPNCHVNILP